MCVGTLWHPRGTRRWVAGPAVPISPPAVRGGCRSAGGASHGASCSGEQILPLLIAGECHLPPSSPSSPPPSGSPTSPAQPSSFLQNAGDLAASPPRIGEKGRLTLRRRWQSKPRLLAAPVSRTGVESAVCHGESCRTAGNGWQETWKDFKNHFVVT